MVLTDLKIDSTVNILIHGQQIELVDAIKYLGIQIDKNLTFDQNLN
jgi:hypothetical protein